ncbi:MAG: DUF2911 domain-containing protein [Gemmatimonadales bacterium]
MNGVRRRVNSGRTARLAWCALLAPALLVASLAAQEYGFVTRLGRDTVAIERVRRDAGHLFGDIVERNPTVVTRHYEVLLAADGSVRTFSIVSHRASAAPGDAGERVDLAFEAGGFRASVLRGGRSHVTMYTTHDPIAMPWLPMAWGLSEQVLIAARRDSGDSTPVTTYLPAGRLAGIGSTVLRRYATDSATIDYRGEPIVAYLDRRGSVVSLFGQRTTNKVRADRVVPAPDVAAIARRFASAERLAGGPAAALSPRDTARAVIGAASLAIDYGRPSLRGRRAIGLLVPVDSVWRTGANEATQLATTLPITLAGIALAAGRYTLWIRLTRQGPTLIINRQTGQWGTDYDSTADVARAPLAAAGVSKPVERFTCRIVPTGRSTGLLVIEWDRFRWTAAIAVR